MKLLVRVIEARIPATDPNVLIDPYVKLQLGKQRFRTKAVKKSLNPSWCEEFTFKVDDLKAKLVIAVLDEDKYFNTDSVGQVKVPVSQVFEAKDKSLSTSWYTLQPRKKAKNKNSGEILVTIWFSQNSSVLDLPSLSPPVPLARKSADIGTDSIRSSIFRSASSMRMEEGVFSKEEKPSAPTLADRIAQIFNKNTDTAAPTSSVEAPETAELSESMNLVVSENKSEEKSSTIDFEELMRTMETKEQGGELPSNLPGGVVLDQLYATTPRELNSIIFSPDSGFMKSVADMQGSTEFQLGPWNFENGSESTTRVVTYIKAPSRLVKALKATEEQTYMIADGKSFAVLASVSTPDAPYGKTFKVEVLYCITLGPELPSGEQTSRLVVSWRMNFLQSTMMKGMIEGGARQGIKESFEQYEKLLSQNVKPADVKEVGSEKDQVLASLQVERQSDWKLAVHYLTNFTVISCIFLGVYVLVHIWLAMPSTVQGLEFVGLDLPDSIGEVIVCGVLVLQGKRVLELISRFMQARLQKGTDHGIKARGEGWLLTVALIEGSNLTAVNSSASSDPYVVFTCNGKRRSSSIKFHKSDPSWNEIFEFDAMDEPPSVLDVEVFDFDGPFNDATSLGRAEINFLKSNISDLSDVWIPLQGKLAQACQSKIHLRVFLNNTRGSNVVLHYLTKMEKEVGKKIKLRSPQTNFAFQKLFALPPEEFLINDFACHLKRKMPLQGRLFLSARIFGFHSDLFGRKTRFFFLWEDIEDIQVVPPTLSSMGSPIIIMTLWPGRGIDARHGARTQDAEGRLKFHFHSFVSFSIAQRTIMALWKARALTPEQKVQIVEEESESMNIQTAEEEAIEKSLPPAEELEAKSLQVEVVDSESESKNLLTEESESLPSSDNINMSLVYSSVLSIPTSFFMELFGGSEIDRRVMDRAGCINYSHSPWESDKPEVFQRQLYYKFDKQISHHRGEVTSTQQKSRLSGKNGWLIEEVMTFHGVPLGDYFNLHLKYQVEDLPSRSVGCNVEVYFGITWSKYSKQQKRMTKNIMSNQQERLTIMFSVLEKEYVSGT